MHVEVAALQACEFRSTVSASLVINLDATNWSKKKI